MCVCVCVCVCVEGGGGVGGGGESELFGIISVQQLSYWEAFYNLTPVLQYFQCVLREIIYKVWEL